MLHETWAAVAVAAEWPNITERTKTSGRATGTEGSVWSLCWGPFTQTGQSFGSSPG